MKKDKGTFLLAQFNAKKKYNHTQQKKSYRTNQKKKNDTSSSKETNE